MIKRFISFNVNSIRARMHQLKSVIEKHQPFVIGLQETKVDDHSFPLEEVRALGYHVAFHGQKSHYGVALLTKTEPLWIKKGFDHALDNKGDAVQARLISGAMMIDDQEWIVMNGYFPQGEGRDHPTKFPMKRAFYADITQQANNFLQNNKPVILMGDANIAAEDIDVGIGENNARRWLQTGKCSFLPEERQWMQTLKGDVLIDTFRYLHPHSTELSWFDYRSQGFLDTPKRGLRIDVILAAQTILNRCVAAGIDHDIRGMEKPSDHCPVWLDIE